MKTCTNAQRDEPPRRCPRHQPRRVERAMASGAGALTSATPATSGDRVGPIAKTTDSS
eukprot:CAMPEP_0198525638 /NCGR_PEP_ID=MMETSP1462-20131121/23476_1 /TAXON_ID=1333877 /ORGANISM="Brandtodinium nutriculum, Strain RCC3387" /LENGTH=57 /DNA_ID=CAMNT_0044255391 /DNA_START=72 /DNA_END=242 /DNA_ORIENTATION=-